MSLLHCSSMYTEVREFIKQARTLCLDPSVSSHSKWQSLETSDPLTLLTVEYGPDVLRGEDADGLTQGTGAEFSGTRPSLEIPPTSMGEHKSGPCPSNMTSFFFSERCSNSTSLMFARLASLMKRHRSLVLLPIERTMVVTMGAPLNKYEFETLKKNFQLFLKRWVDWESF